MMNEYIIPQELNQMDRIGKFTLHQAGIIGLGGLIAMILLSGGLPIVLGFILAIPTMVITLIAAFMKKHNIPIYEFLFIYLMYRSTPKLLIYRADNIHDDFLDWEDENESGINFEE
jgi:hypothetical protein